MSAILLREVESVSAVALTLYIWFANRHSTSSSSTVWSPILSAVAKWMSGILVLRIRSFSVWPSFSSS